MGMRIGAHMSVAGGKDKAFERGLGIRCETIQIFIRSVRSWSSGQLDKSEINKFLKKKNELTEQIWPIISHNSYLINLAGTEEEKLEKSVDAMIDELTKAEQLHLDYVNMHPGNKDPDEEEQPALERIAHQLNGLIQETQGSEVKILLETTAGQGNDLGYKFEHMRDIIKKIRNKERIGVTFDTAHSFAAGYDFTTKTAYESVMQDFDDIIGLEYLYVLHFNDSAKELGSRVDRHAHIGEGKIGREPFGYFLNDNKLKDLPGILETPKGKNMEGFKKDLKVLRKLRE
ncbi:MAG: deoxyribonuclease IV [Promethearchaeia archaeon]